MEIFRAYLITNQVDGKKYVGVTKHDVQKRWEEHVREASSSTRARKLHRAIAKHGAQSFSVVHFASATSRQDLAALEIILIEQEGTFWTDGHGYNLTRGGEGPRGAIVTEETREKQGIASRGRVPSDATRAKLRAAKTGVTHSEGTKAKLRAIAAARPPMTEERRAAQAAQLRAMPPEIRKKAGAMRRGRKQSPELVEKRIASHRGRKRPLSTRIKLIAAKQARNPQQNLFSAEELMATKRNKTEP